jgi:adenylylsulfate kinase
VTSPSAFISPFKEDRDQVKKIVGAENYIEVFVDTPLEVCEQRDVKGLYKKARAGEIKNFTGIDSAYEIPASPDIIIQTHVLSVNDSLDLLLSAVEKKIALG